MLIFEHLLEQLEKQGTENSTETGMEICANSGTDRDEMTACSLISAEDSELTLILFMNNEAQQWTSSFEFHLPFGPVTQQSTLFGISIRNG